MGAILAGGASRRMGTDKARLEVDGVALVDRVGAALRAAGARDVLVIGPAEDRWPGEGPLGGLATALLAVDDQVVDAEVVVVAGCDHPDLDPGLVRRLLRALDEAGPEVVAAAPRTGDGRVQVLPSAWRVGAGPVIASMVDAGERRLERALGAGAVVLEGAEASELADIDTPAELDARRDRHRADPGPPRTLPR